MSVFFVMPLNFLWYFATFIYFYKKYGFTICSFIWLLYSVFAAFSVYLCLSGLYWEVMFTSTYEFAPLSPIPLFLNYLCVYLILMPLNKIRFEKINFSCINYSKRNWNIVYILFSIDIIYALIKLNQLRTAISVGFGNLHGMGGDYISALYYEGNIFLSLFNSIGRFTHIMIVPFVILFVVRAFKQAKCSKKFLFSYLIVFLFNSLSIGLTTGSRANLFFGIINLSFFIILFWRDLSRKFKKYIAYGLFFVSLILITVTAQITEERFGNNLKRSAMNSIYEYLGETFPVLGYEYWGNINHTGGERLFSEFYRLFDDNLKNRDANYWYHLTGARMDWFKTLYGDLYVEFGPIIPVLILFIIAFLFTAYLRGGSGTSCERISVIYKYYSFCIAGLFGFIGFSTIFDVTILCLIFTTPYFIKKQFCNKNNNAISSR